MKIKMEAARANAGLTRGNMAKRLSVTEGTLYRWEHGKTDIPVGKLNMFCQICGIELSDIILPKSAT